MKTTFIALACLALAGCKGEQQASGTSPSSAALSSAAPLASAGPPKKEVPWYQGTWTGSYEAAQNKLEAAPGSPRDWAKDDGSKGSGKGTLKLSVDEKGILQGEAEGALGSQAVTGTADADTLRLTLAPKQPGDLTSFRGTAVVRRDGDVVRGPLNAGSGDGGTLRQANLELRRAP